MDRPYDLATLAEHMHDDCMCCFQETPFNVLHSYSLVLGVVVNDGSPELQQRITEILRDHDLIEGD